MTAATARAASIPEAGGGSFSTAQVIDFAQDGLGLVSHRIIGGVGGDAILIESGLITTEDAIGGHTGPVPADQQLVLTGTPGGTYVYTTHDGGGGGNVDPAATQFTDATFTTPIGGQIDNDRGRGAFEETPYGSPLTIGAAAGPNIFLEWHEVAGEDHTPSITFGYDVLDVTNATHRTDFFRLENLQGGSTFDIEVLTDETTYGFFDSRLTFYDSGGSQLDSVDGDAGFGAHEALTGIGVPGDGVLVVEVNNSKAADGIVGTYELALTGTASLTVALEVVFDRDSGSITLNNANAGATDIKGYSIQSSNGALIESNFTSLADDATPGWVQLTAPGATGDLSEAHLTTDAIAGSGSIMLDNGTDGGWLRYYDESDISFQYLDGEGDLVNGSVSFTGNGGVPFENGDLNLDGAVDIDDWLKFTSEFSNASLVDLSIAESYFAADLDGDGQHALTDFVAFRDAFDAANGVGAFAAMVTAVPEPTSISLTSLGLGSLLLVRRRRSKASQSRSQPTCVTPGEKQTMTRTFHCCGPARSLLLVVAAAIITTSTIERDASGQLSNPLTSADGYDEGTSTYQLSAASPTVTRINTTGTAQTPGDDGEVDVNIGFTFNFYGIDYTDLQVNGNGHLYLGTGYDPAGNYINGGNANSAHPEDNGGSIHTNYSGPRIDFFWEDTDSTSGGAIYTETRGAAGSREFVVEYDRVPPFANESLATVQAILREGSNEITYNYIDINDGLSHRNGVAIGIQGSSDDYHQYGWFPAGSGQNSPLSGSQIGYPSDGESLLWSPTPADQLFHLEVNIDTGKISIEGGLTDRNITGFEITSAKGALNSAGFTGIGAADQVESPTGATPGAGNDPGESWETLGASDNQLIQAFLLGNSLFDNDRSTSLGNAFDTSTPEPDRDLEFSVSLFGGGTVAAGVVYVEGGFDPADLNEDGFVDGLDLGIQLGNFNQVADASGGELNGTPPVDGLDLGILLGAWSPPAVSGATAAVPEPTSLVLAGLGLAGVAVAGRRR